MTPSQALERRAKLEALVQGGATPGEREAARQALERHDARYGREAEHATEAEVERLWVCLAIRRRTFSAILMRPDGTTALAQHRRASPAFVGPCVSCGEPTGYTSSRTWVVFGHGRSSCVLCDDCVQLTPSDRRTGAPRSLPGD